MFDMLNGQADCIDEVVRIMRLLADPTRLRLLSLLRGNELNVTTICRRLNLAQPTVSHHLGLLRSVDLVCNRRQGKQVFYSVNPDAVDEYGQRDGLSVSAGPVWLQLRAPVDAEQPVAAECA